MNFVLQKKIKDLNTKMQLKTIEEMTKNGKININNNISNININANINNYKNKDKDKEKTNEIIKTEKNNEEDLQNITPENYTLIKSYLLKDEFKWYLFRKKSKITPIRMSLKKFKKHHFKDEPIDNLDDSLNNCSYSDFVWVSGKNKKELEEFWDLTVNESLDKEKIIKQLKSKITILENKCKKREKEYNLLNMNYSKLIYKNKNDNIDKLLESIDRLRNENKNLSKRLLSYSSRKNYIGLSFIEDDDNNSYEDKCLEEILDELDNNDINENKYFYGDNYNDIYNNNANYNNNYYHKNKNTEYNNCYSGPIRNVKSFKEKMYYNTTNKFYPVDVRKGSFKKNVNEIKNKEISIPHLKSSIDSLMAQIEPSQSAKAMFANILGQLGCSDDDIYKLIGNYRGVISIPISKYKK